LIDPPPRSDAAGDTGQRLPKANYTGRQLTGKSQLLLTKKPPLDRALSFLLLHQLKAAHVVAAVVGKRNEMVRIVFDKPRHHRPEDQHRGCASGLSRQPKPGESETDKANVGKGA